MERREARNKFISRKKFSVLRQKVVLFCRHEVNNIYRTLSRIGLKVRTHHKLLPLVQTFGLHLAGSVNSFQHSKPNLGRIMSTEFTKTVRSNRHL